MIKLAEAIRREKMTIIGIAVVVPLIMAFCEEFSLMDRIGINVVMGIGVVIGLTIITITFSNIKYAIKNVRSYYRGCRFQPIVYHTVTLIVNFIFLIPILYFAVYRDMYCAICGAVTAIYLNSTTEKLITAIVLILLIVVVDIASVYCAVRTELQQQEQNMI